MSRTKRTTTLTQFKRIGNRLRRVSKVKKREKGLSPSRTDDNQVILQEPDSKARERMFIEKQRQMTKRAGYRNLTTQVATTGANVTSGIASSQGLNQNIAGGANKSGTSRDEDSEEDIDAYPPVY